MSKCPFCGVGIADHMTHCPVCGKFIREAAQPLPESYPLLKPRIRASSLVLNLDSGIWVATIILMAVNFFIASGWVRQEMWSLYALASCVVLHFCLFRPLRLKVFYWLEAVLQVLFGLAYFLFLDWMTDGVVGWSVTWLIPSVLGALALTVCVWLSIRRRDPGNLLLMAMSLFIVTLTLWLVGMFVFDGLIPAYTVIPTFTSFLLSGAVFVFFAVFRFRFFLRTLFKRFHV